MCFNLFGPLVPEANRELATRLMNALLPGEVTQVREARIEYRPKPVAEYLGDRTAFDAFIDYERHDGRRAFLGIETKLTEPFSTKNPPVEPDSRSASSRTARVRAPFEPPPAARASMARRQASGPAPLLSKATTIGASEKSTSSCASMIPVAPRTPDAADRRRSQTRCTRDT
jgi:hypothetical protein